MVDRWEEMVESMMTEMGQCEYMMLSQICVVHYCVHRVDTPIQISSAIKND